MALQSHVAVAKAGVDALSATTAIEYGPRGITSNVITPGPISGTEGMNRLGNREEEAVGAAFKKVPLQRYGSVKEIADGTVFLFSDTGNFVNGSVLVVGKNLPRFTLSESLLMQYSTDGGSWRSPGGMNSLLQYPDYLLDDTYVKKAKL